MFLCFNLDGLLVNAMFLSDGKDLLSRSTWKEHIHFMCIISIMVICTQNFNVFLLHASEKQHAAVAKQCERSRRCLLSPRLNSLDTTLAGFSTKNIQCVETDCKVVDRSDHLFVELPLLLGNSKLVTPFTRSKDVATATNVVSQPLEDSAGMCIGFRVIHWS